MVIQAHHKRWTLKCFRTWSWIVGNSYTKEIYQVHNVELSNWPTQEIQNDSISKPKDLDQKSNEEQTKNKSHVHKHRTYVNWFQQNLWPPIMATIKKYHANRTNALHFLKIVYRKLRCPNPYEKLGKTNLNYDWFTNKK